MLLAECGQKWELAYKPGSVLGNHSSRADVAERLKRPTRKLARAASSLSYIVLLQVGFTLPPMLPSERCALTAPFHPYLTETRRYIFCGTFRRLAPPRHYLAPCPAEPGLSSPATNAAAIARPTPAGSVKVQSSMCGTIRQAPRHSVQVPGDIAAYERPP